MGKASLLIPTDPNSLALLANPEYDIEQDIVFKKYSNQSKPITTKKTRSSILPYVGAWNKPLAIHLIRRTMFGAKPTDVNTVLAMTPSAAVDALLNNAPNPFAAPVNYYENIYADTTGVALGATWINADYGDGSINYYREVGHKGMWLRNLINQNLSIHEKMVLFLHNLVPVQSQAVGDARFEFRYHMLLRQYATGNYKAFLKDVTKNGAMLYYLNGYANNKFSPDENYARELQELFSVGKEGGQQYLETDVIEAAKVLTGWRVDSNTLSVSFDPVYHETANKTFSAFYNNTVITGQAGANGGDLELDALLNMIFSGNSAQVVAKYVCRKLYRFFMHYEVDATIEANIIAPLAQTFITSNWELKPVIAQLFKSQHFFDLAGMGSYIKNPLDFAAGIMRTMNVQPNPASTLEEFHNAYIYQNSYIAGIGMRLLDPPNVSGNKAYYQAPEFHQLWINSNTYPKRLRWCDNLVSNYGFYVSAAIQLKSNLAGFVATLSNPSNPDMVVDEIINYFYGVDLSVSKRAYFKAYLFNNNTNPLYWTNAWNDYIGSPGNVSFQNIVNNRLRNLLREMLHMEENNLC
jgi:uncharacterized protein (DUF1800 family)